MFHIYELLDYLVRWIDHLANYLKLLKMVKMSHVSSMWVEGIVTVSAQKFIQQILVKLAKILNHTRSSCIIFCANDTYYLQEESTHFGLRVSTNVGLEVSIQFEGKKFDKENKQYSETFRNIPTFNPWYSIPSCINISFINTTQTTSYLVKPIFCHHLLPLLFFLTYTTCANLSLWLNLNYKNLLKCVDTTKLLPLLANCYQLLNFILFFINQKWHYFFLYLLTCPNPSILLGVMQ